MPHSLQDFYQTVTRYGLARNNLLRLEQITGLTGDGKPIFPSNDDDRNFNIYLKTATLPSRKIETTTVNYKSFNFNIPMGATYPDSNAFSVTFYSDKYYIIRDLFERWSNGTYNEHRFITTTNFQACNIYLSLVDNSDANTLIEEMKPIKRYILVGCFPNLVGGINYDTSSNGDIVTIPATLSYQYVISETPSS